MNSTRVVDDSCLGGALNSAQAEPMVQILGHDKVRLVMVRSAYSRQSYGKACQVR